VFVDKRKEINEKRKGEEEEKRRETVHSNSNKSDMSVCLSIYVYRREKKRMYRRSMLNGENIKLPKR